MNKNVAIGLLVVLLIALVGFMLKDMMSTETQDVNPYSYELDDYKSIDSSKICYSEIKRFNIDIENLRAVSVDDNDNIYLAGNGRVIILDKDFNLKSTFNVEGENYAMTISKSGLIYLSKRTHIEVWNDNGELVKSWEAFNEKSFLTSIALKEDQVFVADAGNKSMLKYSVDGNFIKEIGKRNKETGEKGFFIPSPYFDVALGRNGEIWAVNSGYHQLEAFNQEGEKFSSWKKTSMQWDGFSGCCNPSNIALLSNGSFVTSEKGLVRIKIHAPNGDFICAVATPNEFEDGVSGIDLAVDSNDNIYAIIPQTNELRVYNKL